MQGTIVKKPISTNGVAKSGIAIEMETREKEVSVSREKMLSFELPVFDASKDKLIRSEDIKNVLASYKGDLGDIFGDEELKTVVSGKFVEHLRGVISDVFTTAGIVKNKIATNFLSLLLEKRQRQYCIHRKDCYPTKPAGNRVVYPLYEVNISEKEVQNSLEYAVAYIPVEEAHKKACERYHTAVRNLRNSYSKFWRTRKKVSGSAKRAYESVMKDKSLTEREKELLTKYHNALINNS